MNDSPTPLKVLGPHHVGIEVSDAIEAARFYCETKGFAPIDRPDLGFPGAWIKRDRWVIHFLEGKWGSDSFSWGFHAGQFRITYSVHDMESAASFFSNVFGFPPLQFIDCDMEIDSPTFPDDPPPIFIKVATLGWDDFEIGLHSRGPKRTPGQPNSRGGHLAFGVSNIDEAEAWLKHCGVTYVRKTQRGSGIEQIFLVDPDDHTIELNPSPMP